MKKLKYSILAILFMTIVALCLMSANVKAAETIEAEESNGQQAVQFGNTGVYLKGNLFGNIKAVYENNTVTFVSNEVYSRQDASLCPFEIIPENDFFISFPLPEGTAKVVQGGDSAAAGTPLYSCLSIKPCVDSENIQWSDSSQKYTVNDKEIEPKYVTFRMPFVYANKQSDGSIENNLASINQYRTIAAYDAQGNKLKEVELSVLTDYKKTYDHILLTAKTAFNDSLLYGKENTSSPFVWTDQDDNIIDGSKLYTLKVEDESIIKLDSKNSTIHFLKPGQTTIKAFNSVGMALEFYIATVEEDIWDKEFAPMFETTIKTDNAEEIKDKIDVYMNTIVNVEKATEIDKSVFEKLSNTKESSLTINTSNAVWEFESSDIKNKDVTLKTEIKVQKNPFEKIKNTTIKDALFIDFSHSGNLPGKANVTLNVGTEKYGNSEKTLYLYYYNEDTKKYEYIDEVIYNKGSVTLTLEHCSMYSLSSTKINENSQTITSTENSEAENSGEKDGTPDTGVKDMIEYALAITTIAGIGIISLKKKK